MAILITSQGFISEEIVAEKLANEDFEVQVSPVFVIDGQEYQVVMDGHHSYQAAIEAGVEPVIVEQTMRENDRIALLEQDVNLFLEACYMDEDWHDIATGRNVW